MRRHIAAVTNRVAILEDDAALSGLLTQILGEAGFNVSAVYSDGRKAERGIKSDPPDALLMDMQTPFLTGEEILHSIKADPELQDIAVIMMSGYYHTGKDQARAMDQGALYAVTKPFDFDFLIGCVNRALRARSEMMGDGRSGYPSNRATFRVENRLYELGQSGVGFCYAYADLQSFKSLSRTIRDIANSIINGTMALIDHFVRDLPPSEGHRPWYEITGRDPLGFAGHAGDDFYFSFSPERLLEVCESICRGFDEIVRVSGAYSPDDLSHGFIVADKIAPIVSIPIVVVSNVVFDTDLRPTDARRTFSDPRQLYEQAKSRLVVIKAALNNRNYREYADTIARGDTWSVWELYEPKTEQSGSKR